MNRFKNFSEHFSIVINLLKWTAIATPVGIATGSAVALFLWLLDKVTTLRWQNGWLLFLLPLAGIFIYFLYTLWGKNSEKGNNLIIDEIHKPGGGVPFRMAPLVFITTIITHLFGGSAGREGTAVQMGGSIAQVFGKWFRLKDFDIRIVLTAGIAAGFGAVFGTPFTGAVFAIEVLAIGRMEYGSLLPCLIASIIGHITCAAWGIHHTQYSILFKENISSNILHVDVLLISKVILAGVCFGLSGFLFAEMVHILKSQFKKFIKIPYLIPVAGALIIIALTYILGTRDYLGLGVSTSNENGISIINAFHINGATHWSWFWKIIFTAVTLGAGFKGGEVTPLFFIGATLGNTLSWLIGAPVDLFAGIGFIAVFAGATNTPLACTIMGVELFGGEHILYFAIACFTAYFFSGHSGIYISQQIAVPKIYDAHFSNETSIKESAQRRRNFFIKSLRRYYSKEK